MPENGTSLPSYRQRCTVREVRPPQAPSYIMDTFVSRPRSNSDREFLVQQITTSHPLSTGIQDRHGRYYAAYLAAVVDLIGQRLQKRVSAERSPIETIVESIDPLYILSLIPIACRSQRRPKLPVKVKRSIKQSTNIEHEDR